MEKNNADAVASAPGHSMGLLASLQRLLGSLSEILYTRLEILSTEVEESAWIVGQLVVYILLTILFLLLGLLLLTAFIIVASPQTYHLYVLAGFAVFYLLLSVVFAWLLLHKLKTRSRLFSTTLSELDKDRHHLGPHS